MSDDLCAICGHTHEEKWGPSFSTPEGDHADICECEEFVPR